MKILSHVLAMALLAVMSLPRAEPLPAPPSENGARAATDSPAELHNALDSIARDALVNLAIELLDTAYRNGGTSPVSGLDCSGLVQHVYEQATGISLPHSSREMARGGEQVEPKALMPGDLLFFARPRKPISHVGIYIGDGLFIHAATNRRR